MSRVNAVRIHRNGGPEELRYEETEIGDPGPGEARVRHTAIGLNFTDIHHRTGRYPLPQFPHVIGMEAAGVVEAVGAGVSEVRPGDRVAYASDRPRAYSQATVIPITRLVKLPDFIDDETAAAVILKGLTAQYLIRAAHTVSAGETILIQAAAGGVGLIMCQWARHLGARVIGTVGTVETAAKIRSSTRGKMSSRACAISPAAPDCLWSTTVLAAARSRRRSPVCVAAACAYRTERREA
jgi:NADPH2:quinone reductase